MKGDTAGLDVDDIGSTVASVPAEIARARVSVAFELLVATVLSAQCTDARVNLVTPRPLRAFSRLRVSRGSGARPNGRSRNWKNSSIRPASSTPRRET